MNVYSYDNRGRLQRIVFADGVIRSNSYDQASNPTRRQYSSGPDLQFTYDSLNRLASANGLSFAYDPEGRVTNTISSGVNQDAAYDADGRLTSITCPNGASATRSPGRKSISITTMRDGSPASPGPTV